MTTTTPQPGFGEAFPGSTKVHVEGPGGVLVPMREIALSGAGAKRRQGTRRPDSRLAPPSGAAGHGAGDPDALCPAG
jgi:hypothetical protein